MQWQKAIKPNLKTLYVSRNLIHYHFVVLALVDLVLLGIRPIAPKFLDENVDAIHFLNFLMRLTAAFEVEVKDGLISEYIFDLVQSSKKMCEINILNVFTFG